MKRSRLFTCEITKYKIEFIIDESSNFAILNTIICDYKNFKAFLALLRNSIDKLIKSNITKIRQSVSFQEWEYYLKNKTTYDIVYTDTKSQIYDIECSSSDFLQNYGIGIGLLD